MNPYRSKEWHAFKSEIIRLDGGVCTSCERGEIDGVILQVHHKQYIKGKNPWEYPHNLCETLCKGCHARIHKIIQPATGWEFIGLDDLGDLDGTCELCGTAIRYVCFISHENWHPMEVGADCYDKLTATQIAGEIQQGIERHRDRIKRFISSKRWRSNNNWHFITQAKIPFAIYPSGDGFRIKANNTIGKNVFPDLLAAKIHIFEKTESGEIQKFLRNEEKHRERVRNEAYGYNDSY